MLYSQHNVTEEKIMIGRIKEQSGFSMVELIITMTVFVVAIAAVTSIFVPMLTQFKQQSKIAESQVERVFGLDILRRDVEQAGFGLPWVIPSGVNYQEAVVEPKTPWIDRDYNDGPPTNPTRGDELAGDSNPPGAIRSGNDVGLNFSDVLVVKATNIATNDAAFKWTYVTGAVDGGSNVNVWESPPSPIEDLNNGDRVIVLVPMRGTTNQRMLVHNAGVFSVQFDSSSFPSAYAPSTENDIYLIYGVDPDTDLRMPFNRADFYVRMPADMPPRCATGTGVLYKGIVNQADGLFNEIRLMECVVSMQVIYGWDNDKDGDFEPGVAGSTDGYLNDINDRMSSEVREQLKEVRVYILAHEGQRVQGYTFSNFTGGCSSCITVGEFGLGRDIDLATVTPDFLQYRWKVYTLVVKPANLVES